MSINRTRRIPFITLSEYAPRAWITTSGCNFRCQGCFSIAKSEVGTPMTVEELIDLVRSFSDRQYGAGRLEEVLVTGGEPTLDREFLIELVRSLKAISDRVTVQTNALLLSPATLDRLMEAGMDALLCDIKTWEDSKHRAYTGVSNLEVLNNLAYAIPRVSMVVNTLLIPGLVDEEEVVNIAKFLARCRPKDLEYRINPFRAELSPALMSRTPSDRELESVAEAARAYYPRTISSRSCLKENSGGPSKRWMTVYPDGRSERRGLDDYRSKNLSRFKDDK